MDKALGALRHENTVVERQTCVTTSTGANSAFMEYQQNFPQINATTASAASSPATPNDSRIIPPLTAQKQEIVRVTQLLLDAISCRDFDSYSRLCDVTMTCFEPETLGNLIEGMDFHKFFFDHADQLPTSTMHKHQIHTTLLNPNVHLMGSDGAVIAYIRLTQFVDKFGDAKTSQFQETRVWQRKEDRWYCIHSHRSATNQPTLTTGYDSQSFHN